MNEQHAYTFVQSSDIAKNWHFAHLSSSIFLYPHPSIQKVLIYTESSENALNVCGYKNWIDNDVISTYMKSAGINLLNKYTFRHTQPFSFLHKSTGPILPFVYLALSIIKYYFKRIKYLLKGYSFNSTYQSVKYYKQYTVDLLWNIYCPEGQTNAILSCWIYRWTFSIQFLCNMHLKQLIRHYFIVRVILNWYKSLNTHSINTLWHAKSFYPYLLYFKINILQKSFLIFQIDEYLTYIWFRVSIIFTLVLVDLFIRKVHAHLDSQL